MELSSIVGYDCSGENTGYNFPNFYYSAYGSDKKRYFFKSINLELGSVNFVVGERKSGKSLFLKSLTGLECPSEKPLDRKFLKYDIVYKPEFIKPKSTGTLQELIKSKSLSENKIFMQYINLFGLGRKMDTNLKDLKEEEMQLLGFCLFLVTEGLIYIMDYPSYLIGEDNRRKMISILKNHCEKNDKIGIITENNLNLINELYDEKLDKKYYIKRFGENEYYGGN